jgi:hypothetical protein
MRESNDGERLHYLPGNRLAEYLDGSSLGPTTSANSRPGIVRFVAPSNL